MVPPRCTLQVLATTCVKGNIRVGGWGPAQRLGKRVLQTRPRIPFSLFHFLWGGLGLWSGRGGHFKQQTTLLPPSRRIVVLASHGVPSPSVRDPWVPARIREAADSRLDSFRLPSVIHMENQSRVRAAPWIFLDGMRRTNRRDQQHDIHHLNGGCTHTQPSTV